MKRVGVSILFLFVFYSVWCIRPYYKLAELNKSIDLAATEITNCLLKHNFEVLGEYNPAAKSELKVIVFTCDELTSLATGVSDKGAFGATLKVGLIQEGNKTLVTLINPCYFSHAYFINEANTDEVDMMTHRIDSLVSSALLPLSSSKEYYGKDIPKDELKKYRFLPYMADYEDVVELAEYDEYLDAVASVKKNILKGVDDSKLIYELAFDDKEICVFGIAFNGENVLENQLIDLLGYHCVTSFPLEVLIQGNKAYILNGKYRIPLYKSDISRLKLFKIMSLSSEIKGCMENIASL
ncbi:hypothetical protein E9993_06285 [Labilibacter sediminis]|nr:hypothetical protein E9993_06285 [Labilibacter sediminis]